MLTVVLTGTVLIQVVMVWTLISGNDPEDGSLPLTSLRLITILGCEALECQPGDLLRREAEDVADGMAPPGVGVTTLGATGP